MDESTQEAPSGTVAEIKPQGYDPVVPTDLLKVMTEEKIPMGAMMFHLVRNATPDDHNYIKNAIAKTEADLDALRTIEVALGVKFAKAPTETVVPSDSAPEAIATLANTIPTSEPPPEPKLKRKYTRHHVPLADVPDTVLKHARMKPISDEADIDKAYDARQAPSAPAPASSSMLDVKPPDEFASRLAKEGWTRRVTIAKFLLDGKKTQKEIMQHFQIPQGSITAIMRYAFFHKDTDGYVYLTTAGRHYAIHG